MYYESAGNDKSTLEEILKSQDQYIRGTLGSAIIPKEMAPTDVVVLGEESHNVHDMSFVICIARSTPILSPDLLPHASGKMEIYDSISWEDNLQSTYVNWKDYIPLPSGMVLPNRDWRGTCIVHAFSECISSRREIISSRNRDLVDMGGHVSIPFLVHELVSAGCITHVGGRALEVSEFILKHGVPLERRKKTSKRAYISDYILTDLVNLQEIKIFDLPDMLNLVQFAKALQQRAVLLLEIEMNGPVVGLFNAGLRWPYANGEVYHDDCGHAEQRSKKDDALSYGPHAALVYGFDNTTNDPFAVELLLQDSMGPSAHTKGRCRMNISSLRGYIAPNIAYNGPRKEYPLGASIRCQNLMGTSMSTYRGENDQVKYAVSFAQGWCENVEDAYSAFLDLDDLTSFFGVYDGHGGLSVALHCAEYFHTEVLKNADYHNNPGNAMKEAFSRLDEITVDKWRAAVKHSSANIWPSVQELSYEGSAADGSTACVTLLRGNKLIIGNAGDSRAVLSRNGQALDLTVDHRIESHCDGDVVDRTNSCTSKVIRDKSGIPLALGKLDISKVIGFVPYKEYTDLTRQEHVVTCVPDINSGSNDKSICC